MAKAKMPIINYVSGVGRFLCTVLDEMRECIKSLNFSYLTSLVEEAQMLGNRMEAALEDQKGINTLHKDIHNLKAVREVLRIEVQELIDKRDSLE